MKWDDLLESIDVYDNLDDAQGKQRTTQETEITATATENQLEQQGINRNTAEYVYHHCTSLVLSLFVTI